MMGRIWAIALNTYREAIRQKVLFALAFFAGVMIVFSLFLAQLSLHADVKIIKDMGLACIMLFGALIAVFVGVGLVFKEIDRRTIYTILSKPVSRTEFILGKFMGLSVTVGLVVFLMTVLMFSILLPYREPLDFNLMKAVVLIYAELCILVAVSLIFSSYSSAFMSSLFSLSLLVIGHLTDDFSAIMSPKIAEALRQAEGLERWMNLAMQAVVDAFCLWSLDHLVINAKVVHGVSVGWGWVANALLYAVSWLAILLAAATWMFRRKDLQ